MRKFFRLSTHANEHGSEEGQQNKCTCNPLGQASKLCFLRCSLVLAKIVVGIACQSTEALVLTGLHHDNQNQSNTRDDLHNQKNSFHYNLQRLPHLRQTAAEIKFLRTYIHTAVVILSQKFAFFKHYFQEFQLFCRPGACRGASQVRIDESVDLSVHNGVDIGHFISGTGVLGERIGHEDIGADLATPFDLLLNTLDIGDLFQVLTLFDLNKL